MSLFEIDIVSEPRIAAGFTALISPRYFPGIVDYDEDIVKPALLFADKVNLVTSRLDIQRFIRRDHNVLHAMPMRRIGFFMGCVDRADPNELSRLGVDPSELPERGVLEAYEKEIRNWPSESDALKEERIAFFDNSVVCRIEKDYGKLIDRVVKASQENSRSWHEMLESDGIKAAIDRGLVTVSAWGAIPDMTTLVWENHNEYYTRIVLDMAARIASSPGVPLVDPNVEASINSICSPFEVQAKRDHVGIENLVAATTCAHLPGLRRLGLEEVIDLRESLSGYLPAFRSEMVRLSEEVQSSEGIRKSDIVREVERRWVRDIDPALSEIAFEVKRASYPRQIIRSLTSSKDALVSSATSVILAAGSATMGLSTLVPSMAAAGYSALKTINSAIEGRAEIKRNSLFFLYSVKKRIENRR